MPTTHNNSTSPGCFPISVSSVVGCRRLLHGPVEPITGGLTYSGGVRPGTIGYARNYKTQYLSWKDVKIKRTENSNFGVQVIFKYLKGYRNENLKPLRFTIAPPTCADDIPYSLGHRLLALALRRNYLRDYTTVDALLSDNKVNIAFKPKILDRPVVCASTPKVRSLTPREKVHRSTSP